ncbi:hypothetical protein [Vibrio owensii]|uniref:hypothetical protein n=1 Tax=Vibrio harveyi group TaxID=717610 RepID=UPI003CC6CBB9
MNHLDLKGILSDFHYSTNFLVNSDSNLSFCVSKISDLTPYFEDIEARKGHTEPITFGGSVEWMPIVALMSNGEPIGFTEFRIEAVPVYSGFEIQFSLEYLYLKEEHRGNGIFSEFSESLCEHLTEYLNPWFESNSHASALFIFSAEYISIQGRKTGEKIHQHFEEFFEQYGSWEFVDSTM